MAQEIVINNLYKLFGRNKKKALKMAQAGSSKSEILATTGSIMALCNISFTVEKGETNVIIGLSGSGKSTLVRHINRLIDPDLGEIIIQGQDILQLNLRELAKIRNKKLSMVFQGFGLLPHWNVQDNVAYGLLVAKVPRKEAYKRITPWLEAVGLADYRLKYPDQLSGGMLQRVGLARAFAVDPEIILLDEPFSALDPLIRKSMQDLLIDWQAKYRKTIVFITHDIAEAFKLGQKVCVLRAGKLEQIGSPEQIKAHPANAYVEKMIASGW